MNVFFVVICGCGSFLYDFCIWFTGHGVLWFLYMLFGHVFMAIWGMALYIMDCGGTSDTSSTASYNLFASR